MAHLDERFIKKKMAVSANSFIFILFGVLILVLTYAGIFAKAIEGSQIIETTLLCLGVLSFLVGTVWTMVYNGTFTA